MKEGLNIKQDFLKMQKTDKTKKINLICKARLDKYKKLSEKAFEMAKKAVAKGREKEAKEIIEMVSCYLSDAKYFEKQGHFVNAFACINYAHGWLDAGSRLGIFDVKDSRLFVVK